MPAARNVWPAVPHAWLIPKGDKEFVSDVLLRAHTQLLLVRAAEANPDGRHK
jgi:hypothetical protein